jgi:hypothetical protein
MRVREWLSVVLIGLLIILTGQAIFSVFLFQRDQLRSQKIHKTVDGFCNLWAANNQYPMLEKGEERYALCIMTWNSGKLP